MRAAVLSSAVPHVDALLPGQLLMRRPTRAEPPPAIVEPLLALAGLVHDQRDRADSVTRTIGEPAGQGGRYAPWQFAALAGLLDARDATEADPADDSRKPLRSSGTPLAQAGHRTIGPPRPIELGGRSSCSAIPRAGRPSDRDLLVGLLRPQVAVAPASGRDRSGATTDDPKVAQIVLRDWKGYSPLIRERDPRYPVEPGSWTAALCSPRSRTAAYPPAEIDPCSTATSALAPQSPELRARAEAVFAHESDHATGGRRRLSLSTGHQGRPSRRRGRLQEALRFVSPDRERRAPRSARTSPP